MLVVHNITNGIYILCYTYLCQVFFYVQFYTKCAFLNQSVSIWYGWKLDNTPQTCNYGVQFTVNHAMICHVGGFPSIRHNEIRDITASLLTEVCSNVATEPALQPLSGENMTARTANTDDDARVNIWARGFLCKLMKFFDVSVFYLNASSYPLTQPCIRLQKT